MSSIRREFWARNAPTASPIQARECTPPSLQRAIARNAAARLLRQLSDSWLRSASCRCPRAAWGYPRRPSPARPREITARLRDACSARSRPQWKNRRHRPATGVLARPPCRGAGPRWRRAGAVRLIHRDLIAQQQQAALAPGSVQTASIEPAMPAPRVVATTRREAGEIRVTSSAWALTPPIRRAGSSTTRAARSRGSAHRFWRFCWGRTTALRPREHIPGRFTAVRSRHPHRNLPYRLAGRRLTAVSLTVARCCPIIIGKPLALPGEGYAIHGRPGVSSL